MQHTPTSCPLCRQHAITFFFADSRSYWQCADCQLVFVDTSEHLNERQEKERYDLHENNANDQGYLNFLNKLILPLSKKLPTGSKGLDFGCGPGPTVSLMLEALGFSVDCYDKYYANDVSLLSNQYDFVTSTEVLEHLREPSVELQRLIGLLRPNGYLGIMTGLMPPIEKFANWHYKRDLTHICFYSNSTFEWIAEHWDLSLEIIGNDVVILHSKETTGQG